MFKIWRPGRLVLPYALLYVRASSVVELEAWKITLKHSGGPKAEEQTQLSSCI